MEYLIVACGALGAWLLVAGPLYQAALELGEQELDREEMGRVMEGIDVPARVSPWWWLLPPVAYILQQRQQRVHRQAVLDALGPEQLEQSVNFVNKASGWMIVASGAFLIAVKETYELIELLHLHVAVFWILVVLLPVLCVSFVVAQVRRTAKMLKKEESPRPRRGARR